MKKTNVAGSQKLTLIEKEHCMKTEEGEANTKWEQVRKRTASKHKIQEKKNEPDKWTMPLMITDLCTKKPVAHIWNFIFLYTQAHAHAPFFFVIFISFWHIHIKQTTRITRISSCFVCFIFWATEVISMHWLLVDLLFSFSFYLHSNTNV